MAWRCAKCDTLNANTTGTCIRCSKRTDDKSRALAELGVTDEQYPAGFRGTRDDDIEPAAEGAGSDAEDVVAARDALAQEIVEIELLELRARRLEAEKKIRDLETSEKVHRAASKAAHTASNVADWVVAVGIVFVVLVVVFFVAALMGR